MQDTKITELEQQITKLRNDVESLSGQFFKNNFSSSQSFNKDVAFNGRLKVPVFSSAPSVGEVGDIMAVSGVLYICTTAGNVSSPAVFTAVGTQV